MAEAGGVPLEALEVAVARIKIIANRVSKIVKSLRQIARKGTSDPFALASLGSISLSGVRRVDAGNGWDHLIETRESEPRTINRASC